MNFQDFYNNLISQEHLRYEFLGNSLSEYIWALLVFVVILISIFTARSLFLSKVLKIARSRLELIESTAEKVVNTFPTPFYIFVALYISSKTLSIGELISHSLDVVLILWVIFQIVKVVGVLLDSFFRVKYKPEEKNAESAVNLVKNAIFFVIWLVGILFLLSNFGINITTLIAGMGIGGVAIAFALQNILGDLFSSLAIFLDKPFQEGDFIVVGNKAGTVEKIGIKTTRVRSLEGEEIVFSNQQLTSEQIQNFKKLVRRRVLINIGVTYDTSKSDLSKISNIVEKIVRGVNDVTFDRVHFKEFSESAQVFEIVFHVEKPEYDIFMDRRQQVLLGIKESFDKSKIKFAFPTRTIHIEK